MRAFIEAEPKIKQIRPTSKLDKIEQQHPEVKTPISEQWRVVGSISNGQTETIVITNDRTNIYIKEKGNCHRPFTQFPEQIECTLNGERITTYSGTNSSHSKLGKVTNIDSTISKN